MNSPWPYGMSHSSVSSLDRSSIRAYHGGAGGAGSFVSSGLNFDRLSGLCEEGADLLWAGSAVTLGPGSTSLAHGDEVYLRSGSFRFVSKMR